MNIVEVQAPSGGLDQVIQNLDPILRIQADSEIVSVQQLDSGIVFQPLSVSAQLLTSAQYQQFIHQITVVHIYTAVVSEVGFITERGLK